MTAYSSVRDFLGCFVGRTVGDVSQHDADDFAIDRRAFFQLTFTDASYIRIPIGDDGISLHCEPPDCGLHPEKEPNPEVNP